MSALIFPRPCCACGFIAEKRSEDAVPCTNCMAHWDSFLGEFGGAFMDRTMADEAAELLALIQ